MREQAEAIHYAASGELRRKHNSLDIEYNTMPAKMITYRFFFFEGLITEFGNNLEPVFFPGGLFLNLVIITDRFFPQGSHFRVR